MTTSTQQQQPLSILIIGATGRTGLECLHKLAAHPRKPDVYAFCRSAAKLDPKDKTLYTSVVEGDARSDKDLERALDMTKANMVIVCVGNGDNVGRTNLRTTSAQALVRVLKKDGFQHVRVLVVSSIGAGPSKITAGFGIGMLVSYHLRHILKDHTGQEAAFDSIRKKVAVIRPTGLTDNKATGKLVEFGDTQKCPTMETDREDLAVWIADAVCGTGYGPFGNATVNLTGVKSV